MPVVWDDEKASGVIWDDEQEPAPVDTPSLSVRTPLPASEFAVGSTSPKPATALEAESTQLADARAPLSGPAVPFFQDPAISAAREEVIGGEIPRVEQEGIRSLLPSGTMPGVEGAVTSALNFAIDMANEMRKPVPLLASPLVFTRAGLATMAIESFRNKPAQIQKVVEAFQSNDPNKVTGAITELAASTAIEIAMARGATRPTGDAVMSDTANVVEQAKTSNLNLTAAALEKMDEVTPLKSVDAATKPEVAAATAIVDSPKSQPEIIGMGGAIPAEFALSAKSPTSIKNAVVDAERTKLGLPPVVQPIKREFGEVWDRAMAEVDRDPTVIDRLVDELRENPRALTDLEDALLLHRQVDLRNEYGKATRDLAQAFDDGRMEAVEIEKARVEEVSSRLLDLFEVGKKSGTETGRGLAARKMMANEDFSLAALEVQKRADVGGRPLTDIERAELVKVADEYKAKSEALEQRLADQEARISDSVSKEAFDDLMKQVEKLPKVSPYIISVAERIVGALDKQADAARVRLQGKLFTLSPDVLADLSIIGASHIGRIGLDFAKWSVEMTRDLGERIKPHLDAVWSKSQEIIDAEAARFGKKSTAIKRAVKKQDATEERASTIESIKARAAKGKESDISVLVQKLARGFVAQGIRERNALVEAVHAELRHILPEITRRETADAISGYGKYKLLSKDEISVQLRDLKGQLQQISKLEDMKAGQAPSKTGIERRQPSDIERRLIKEVEAEKRKGGYKVTDSETQLRTALQSIKTRVTNQISDLEAKLAAGDFTLKKRKPFDVTKDTELMRLKADLERVKEKWHEARAYDRLKNLRGMAKAADIALESMNLSQNLVASYDLSALRQAAFVMLNPFRVMSNLKAIGSMISALSKEQAEIAEQRIFNRPNAKSGIYDVAKLRLVKLNETRLLAQDEAIRGRWAKKIPGIGASNRAFITLLNRVRADTFDSIYASAKNKSAEATRAIGAAVNDFTGYGDLGSGKLGQTADALSTVIWSPRLLSSRFRIITGAPLLKGTMETRKLIAKEYASTLLGMWAMYELAMMAGFEVESDPRSASFGKLRDGEIFIDPMGGLIQVTVLEERIRTGKLKTQRGEIQGRDLENELKRFGRSKVRPVIGAGLDTIKLFTEAKPENMVGEPITPASIAVQVGVPMVVRDIADVMEEAGVVKGTAYEILQVLGAGLQVYDPDKKRN